MAGSISKTTSTRTGKITWRARYRDASGRQHETRHKRRTDAQKWLDEQSAKVVTGTHSAPARGRVTVADIAESWLGKVADEAGPRGGRRWTTGTPPGLTPSTAARYRGLWLAHVGPRWGNMRLDAVEHGDVADWVADLASRRSASTTRQAHRLLALILARAVRDRRLGHNVAAKVPLPSLDPHEVEPLPIEQVKALVDACGRDADLVLTLATLGLRFGELAELRVASLSVDEHQLTVRRSTTEVGGYLVAGKPKGKKPRFLPVPAYLLRRLEARAAGRQATEFLFTSPRGHQLRLNNWRRTTFQPALEAAGIRPDLRVHDLRHSAVSVAIALGADPKMVQEMVGHSSAAMTYDVYTHLFPNRMKSLGERMNEAHGGLFD